jgi:membrane-associated phospholipid phosphatase
MSYKHLILVLLSIVWTISGVALPGHAQTRLSAQSAVPDISPSTAIADGAPSFHLAGSFSDWDASANGYDTTPATASDGQEGFVSRAVKRGLQDQKEIWTAPFHRNHIKWDALFLAGTGTLLAVDEQILHALPNTQVSTSSTVSNSLIAAEGAALGGIFFIRGLHGGDSHAKETGVLGIETLANTFLVYLPLQIAAGRERPNEGTGEGNFLVRHSVNTSFPGGHSMFAFSMATVIAHEYPRWWVQLLSYGAASAITGARMTAKMHFPSDLLVGGALGYLIGTHIFHAHCNPDLGGDCHVSDKEGP